jgi:betaine reductase
MRIVHYINQFYGQIGGEDKADYPLEVRNEVSGPGRALSQSLAKDCQIVATIVCGDNYFAENEASLTDKIAGILKENRADLLVAGPAFTAGRYGIACGSVCKIAHQLLGIPAVSGMYKENPGLDMYRKFAYIFPTANNARGMKEAIDTMAAFINKLAANEEIGGPEEEGYFVRGVRSPVFCQETGAKRAVNMILDKLQGREFKTEIPMPSFNKYTPSAPIKDVKKATIAIMTSGGIVPTGNPDRFEACFCSKFKRYSLDDYGGPQIPNSEVAHGGYDPVYANEDGNRVLPIDAAYEMELDGEIGRLYPYVYVTVGNAMAVDQATAFGDAIARELKEEGIVDGVILTST